MTSTDTMMIRSWRNCPARQAHAVTSFAQPDDNRDHRRALRCYARAMSRSLVDPSTEPLPPPPDPVDEIAAFLSRFTPLSQTQQQLLRQLTRIERYPRGTVLLREGALANESWLVVRGCLRVFRGSGPDARTVGLHTELHPVIPPSYGTDTPSPVSIECLEDVVASATTPHEEARGFAGHPELETLCRIFGQAMTSALQEAHIDALTLSAEQRYLDLVARRPDLLQRVPQYHIASYLGIQPETLSRIRRRITRRGPAAR